MCIGSKAGVTHAALRHQILDALLAPFERYFLPNSSKMNMNRVYVNSN